MKKIIIISLILSHIACVWIGFRIGEQRESNEAISAAESNTIASEEIAQNETESQEPKNTENEIRETTEPELEDWENNENEKLEIENEQSIETYPKENNEIVKPTPTEEPNVELPNFDENEFGLGEESF